MVHLPKWLYSENGASKIVTSIDEHTDLVAKGWKDSPADFEHKVVEVETDGAVTDAEIDELTGFTDQNDTVIESANANRKRGKRELRKA